MFYLFLDAGHNKQTPGKQSPDGAFKEWEFNRKLRNAIMKKLEEYSNIKVIDVHPGDDRISNSESFDLNSRWMAANRFVIDHKLNKRDCLFLSLHVNASGSVWDEKACGWSVYCHDDKSLANEFAKAAHRMASMYDLLGNRCKSTIVNYANFAVLRYTSMPAVLTENLFMSNHNDLKKLADEKVFNQLIKLHINALLHYYSFVIMQNQN